MSTPTPHYYIKLNDEGLPSIPSDQILLTTPNTTITFELNNGTPISHHIALISNIETPFPFGIIDYMLTASCPISRVQLQPFTFLPYDVSTSILFQVHITHADPHQFLFIYQTPNDPQEHLTKPFYIIVQPTLTILNKVIPIHSINMQTVLSKNIGKLNDIRSYFKEANRLK